MRLRPLIAACLAAATLGGCGDDAPPPRPQKPVQLTISAPADTAVIDGARMQVRGTVSPPGARVRVQGRRARVSGGEFSSNVKLAHGANVIDVAASASGRAAALTAFRVTRQERIAIPDLVGLDAGEAEREAQRLDLKLESERGGGFLDSLVPSPLAVCEQSPRPGTRVLRGATVQVLVARSC